jgi:hypothetical protein
MKNGAILREVLESLPLISEDLYLRMQALNLGFVDDYLEQLEQELLQEYFERERTPTASAVFVSALSQFWIFGVYEFLRTWRQRIGELIQFAEKWGQADTTTQKSRLAIIRDKHKLPPPWTEDMTDCRWRPFEQVIRDEGFLNQLRTSYDNSEHVFRKIEALRIHLAKHEVPKTKGVVALAPGYGRINMQNGSIYYQVLLRDKEIDIISRKDIADLCRELDKDRSCVMLPWQVRKSLESVTEYAYGLKLVIVKLGDGKEFKDVHIAWNKEVLYVNQYESLPFSVSDVIEVRM